MFNRTGSDESVVEGFRQRIWKKIAFILTLTFVSLTVGIYSLTIGSYEIGFSEVVRVIVDHLMGNINEPLKNHFVWNLRLPRVLLGVLVGAGLATVGATMQSILKNPLADPYTTGISSGASFGATLAMILGISVVGGSFAVVVNAFVFSLIPVCVIILVSRIRHASPTTMILSGIAVMYIFGSLTTLFQLRADPDDLKRVYNWGVGSLGYADWTILPVCAAFTVAGMAAMMLMATRLNVLSSGDDSAKSLGVDADRFRTIGLLIASLTTAGLVSFTGPIGFVGLVSPHVARIFIGSDNRFLLPASAAFGVTMILIADMVGRIVVAPAILQVGVVMSFIGGPMFLYILIRQKREVWRRSWTSRTSAFPTEAESRSSGTSHSRSKTRVCTASSDRTA